MKEYIAERKLLYSEKGSNVKNEFFIRIGIPYIVTPDMVEHYVAENYSGCHVEIDGLTEEYSEVYGADSVQALNLASNLEPFLKKLNKKYDLYWSSGEPYF